MRSYTFDDDVVFATDEVLCSDPQNELTIALQYFIDRRRLVKDLVRKFGERNELKGCALLLAHGNRWNGRWSYCGDDKPVAVQDFVDSLDGKVNAILLYLCNPKNDTVSSASSIVVHPHSDISRIRLIYGNRYSMRVRVPGEGYLEKNQYLLKKTLGRLTQGP